jgi:hypothetical protein
MVSFAEVRKAGRRLSIAALLLAAASAIYYFSDEVPFAYLEVDGYLPVLWIVRLGALVVAMGLLFALVYPLSVLAVRGPLAVRDWRRTARVPGGPPRTLRLERVVDVLLCLAVLVCAYRLVKPALLEALLPLRGVAWVGQVFTIACAAGGALLIVALVWLGLGFLPNRRSAPMTAGEAPTWPPAAHRATVVTVPDAAPSSAPAAAVAAPAPRSCGSCGAANAPQAAFCRSCGASLGGPPR